MNVIEQYEEGKGGYSFAMFMESELHLLLKRELRKAAPESYP
jgi:hypothetical protein